MNARLPSVSGATSTVCPSDSSRRAVSCVAAATSGSTGVPVSVSRSSATPQAPRRRAADHAHRLEDPVAAGPLRHREPLRAVAHRDRLGMTDGNVHRPDRAAERHGTAPRRLEPEHAAAGRGHADRSTAVGRVRGRHDPRRHQRRRASRRSAGAVVGVPGIARRAAEQRLGGAREPELRRGALAEEDEPGFLECVDVGSLARAADRPKDREPECVGSPRTSSRSLMNVGTPAKGPASGPRAASRARPKASVTMALIRGSTASALPTAASTASSAVMRPLRIASAVPTASTGARRRTAAGSRVAQARERARMRRRARAALSSRRRRGPVPCALPRSPRPAGGRSRDET